MLLREIGEVGFVERISGALKTSSHHVIKGIGDDAAVIRVDVGMVQVITTDTLVENVDFLRDTIPPEQLGHKALAVSLSDLAAMGARPDHALVTLCVPERYTVEYLTAVYDGLRALAGRFGVNILGGDLSAALHDLVISVTAIGSAREHEVCYRDGAKAGDAILLVGVIGESGAGLDTLGPLPRTPAQEGCTIEALPDEVIATLRRRHLEPEPLVQEGRWLAQSGKVRAMVDLSDGIGTDLGHIAKASGVGAVVETSLLPATPSLRAFLEATRRDALRYLLYAGEDYALLFTAAESDVATLTEAFRRRFPTPITRIGTITDGPAVVVRRRDGSVVPLARGFNHFGAT